MESVGLSLISCSNRHAAAIGAYGQVYVWGENMFSGSGEPARSYQLGFCENEYIPSPVYFYLTHPLYSVKATQIACGANFTAIIAKRKLEAQPKKPEINELELEINDSINDLTNSKLNDTEKEIYSKALPLNKSRSDDLNQLPSDVFFM
jgi:alpha-tubulin suppressor-like RCC1 family protein